MLKALKVIESLNLKSIVCVFCVFDQAIYAKAIELKWKDQEKLCINDGYVPYAHDIYAHPQ